MQNKSKITACDIASMAYFLNTVLDREHVLYKKIKCFYQHISDRDIYKKNEYFETQYILVEKMIHEIENKIFHLGYYPEISLRGFLILNWSQEIRNGKRKQEYSLKCILENIESIIESLQENGEMVPCRWNGMDKTFFTKLIDTHKQIAVMLGTQLWKFGEFFTLRNRNKSKEVFILDHVN